MDENEKKRCPNDKFGLTYDGTSLNESNRENKIQKLNANAIRRQEYARRNFEKFTATEKITEKLEESIDEKGFKKAYFNRYTEIYKKNYRENFKICKNLKNIGKM